MVIWAGEISVRVIEEIVEVGKDEAVAKMRVLVRVSTHIVLHVIK